MFYVRSRGVVVEAEKISLTHSFSSHSLPYSLLRSLPMAPIAELHAQLAQALAVVPVRRAELAEARRVRRNALQRQRYADRTAPARAAARAQALAARPNFVSRNPRYHSTRMSTGGHAPRRHFDAEFHRAQIRSATVRLELAQDEVKYFRTLLDVEEALARSSE